MIEVSGVTLDGTTYRLASRALVDRPYHKSTERPVVQRSAIVGTSRFAQSATPDILEWVVDDWSAGEGYKYLNPEGDDASQRGYFQSDGVDLRIPGQIRAGGAVSNIKAVGSAPTTGPYLATAGGNVWLAYDAVTQYTSDASTWNTVTSGMNAQNITGPITPFSTGIFIAGVRSGADGGLRRVDTSGNTSWTATSCRSPLAADNRVYVLARGTTTSTRQYVGLDAAAALTVATTYNGIGSTYSSAPLCSVAVGSTIYTLMGGANESPRLWAAKGTEPGAEVAVFEGLRVTAAEPGTQVMAVVNGIVFVGGWNANTTFGEVQFYDGQTVGSIGAIRSDVSQTSGTVTAVAPGRSAELLIGLTPTTGAALLFRYDLQTAGLSLVGKTTSTSNSPTITSAAHNKGVYYFAYKTSTDTRVDKAVAPTDAAPFGDSPTIDLTTWDFGLPFTEKLLTEIEVQTATLDASTSVSVSFGTDGAASTTVTTDSAAAAMTHSSGGRTKFTVSGASVERIFRYLSPRLTITTSSTKSPTLAVVVFRAVPIASVTRFEFYIDCTDESATSRKTGRQVSGRALRAALDTLIADTSNRVWTLTPLFEDSGKPYPAPTATQVNVILEESDYIATGVGEGVYRIKVRQV